MWYADDYIIEILSRLPSECAYLDYKEIPYLKDHYQDLMKDVIAMLNSEEGIGHKKAIIFGVSDEIPPRLLGIDSFLANAREKFDDANYQNIFDRITPRPHITVGTVTYQGKAFGYVFMDDDLNREWIYEAKETYVSKSPTEKYAIFMGQAFTRRGSKNYVMMQQDRDHLKEICALHLSAGHDLGWQSVPISTNKMDPLLAAAIIGGWNENNQDDCTLIELLSGIPYQNWIQTFRNLHENKDPSIRFSNNFWSVNTPEEVIKAFGIQLYDCHLGPITTLVERVFSDYDTKYDLEPDDRFAASIYQKTPRYSPLIRHGISRFLAIAGNFPERFSSCSSWKLTKLIDDAIKKVIGSPDWRILATMERNFQLLAEANPMCFAKSVQEATARADSGLCIYLSESETLLGSTQFYGSLLVYALTRIACKREFFSYACFSAFCVLKICPEHLAKLASVFLPWAPKTEAPPAHRIALVRQFFDENDDLAWELLCALLPERTTFCEVFEKPTYLACKMKDLNSPPETRWKESNDYLELAIEKGSNRKDRLLTLQEFLDKVPEDIFYKILAAIETACLNYADEDRYIFWNKLLSLFCKHKQFPDADWALPEEALTAMKSLAEKIAPRDQRIKIRRLFQNSTHDILPERYHSYAEKESALSALRLKELDWCYQVYGLESLVCCIESFDLVRPAGTLLAELGFTDECDSNLYTWLISSCDKRKDMAKEYLRERFRTCGISWFKFQLEGRSQEEIAVLLSSLPLTIESMDLAEQLLTDRIGEYWSQVPVWGLKDETKADYIIQRLLQYERPLDALELIEAMHDAWHFLSGETIFKTLKALVAAPHGDTPQHDAYIIVSLIEWLQENWDDKRVEALEWWYFSLFSSYGSKGPRRLYMTLANHPESFMELLCRAFRGRHQERTEISEEESKIGEHSFAVLRHWNIVPGTRTEGTMDSDKLRSWFSTVKKASQEKDRYEVAMQVIGATFFYSPPDPDGLFIHRSVAELLHKEGDPLREGYYYEAINSRGAYFVDPSGAPEFALEKKYHEYAARVDELGLFRFAEKLRLLASFYRSEALHNIEDNRKLRKAQDTD